MGIVNALSLKVGLTVSTEKSITMLLKDDLSRSSLIKLNGATGEKFYTEESQSISDAQMLLRSQGEWSLSRRIARSIYVGLFDMCYACGSPMFYEFAMTVGRRLFYGCL